MGSSGSCNPAVVVVTLFCVLLVFGFKSSMTSRRAELQPIMSSNGKGVQLGKTWQDLARCFAFSLSCWSTNRPDRIGDAVVAYANFTVTTYLYAIYHHNVRDQLPTTNS